MGGLPRRATFIKQEKAEDSNILLLDSGNFISPKPLAEQALEDAESKAVLILRSMVKMGYAAVALGEKDLYLGIGTLWELIKTTNVNFLSANLMNSGDMVISQPYLILKTGGLKVGVIGLTAPPANMRLFKQRNPTVTIGDPLEAARETVAEIRDKCGLVIVLSNAGYGKDMEMAEAVPGIDIIISGGTKRYMKRPKVIGNTILTTGYYEGRAVGKLVVHKDGPVKGWVAKHERDFLDKQVKAAVAKTDTPAGKRHYDDLLANREAMDARTLYEPDMVNLVPSFPDDPEIAGLITEYRKELGKNQGRAVVNTEQVRYIGSGACAGCHESRNRFWLGTPHARAFDSLAPKNAGADRDCLPCHVTGFERRTGYWPRAPREELRGVGCEACHGVGSLHAASPEQYSLIHLPVAPQCLDCHTDEQDEDFDYLRDKGRVCAEM